jgi:hypothetical protein
MINMNDPNAYIGCIVRIETFLLQFNAGTVANMTEVIQMSASPAPIPGYSALANHMGSIPEMTMFRRFGSLNAQITLYYQAQLSYLEDELREIEKRDHDLDSQDPTREECNSDWYYLAGKGADESKKEQWKIVLKIQDVLPKYSKLPSLCMTTTERCIKLTYQYRRKCNPTGRDG